MVQLGSIARRRRKVCFNVAEINLSIHRPLLLFYSILLAYFKYLGSYFVPELNDTADITERISQTRKLFGSMNKQLLGNKKIPVDISRRL